MRTGWEVLESVSFTIPSLPPTKNQLHQIIRMKDRPIEIRRSPKYVTWRQEALPHIPLLKPLVDSHYFKVDAVFEYPFFHVNGKHKRLDCHNFLEALCDTIAEKNGFDDSYIKFTSSEAYNSDNGKVSCTLSQVRRIVA